MTYQHTTFADFKTQLASRLGDPLRSHWVDSELGVYTTEALRTWSMLTGFWRDRGIFSTSPATAFYDINTLPSLSDLTGYAVTDVDTLAVMQYMLCEPPSASGAGATSQFAFADIVAALQRARNQLINDTLVTVGILSIPVSAGDGVVPLPDSTISVRRAVWKTPDGIYSNVHWSDEIEAASYNQIFPLTPGIPETYSFLAAPPLTLNLIPPPIESGTLELVVAATGPDLDPSAPTLMMVPDDTVWIARELAVADVLGRDGPGHDPIRAQFARRRYELGVSLISDMAQIVFVEFGGVPVIPSAVAEIDYLYADPHWQSAGTAAPVDIGIVGGNLIALRPPPDAGPSAAGYSISLDVIRKAPIPVAATDFLQIPREDLAALLDIAQSYAMFKLGGSDLTESNRLFQSGLTAATRYNARLSTLGYGARQQEQSRWQDQSIPEYGSGMGLGALNPSIVGGGGGDDGSQSETNPRSGGR